MTVYLWHFTALVIVALGALLADLPLAEVGSSAWWAAKPMWILASGVILAGLIRVFRRFEAPGRPPHTISGGAVTVAALLFIAAAVRMTTNGFHAPDLPLDVDPIGLGLLLGSAIALENPLRSGMTRRRGGFDPPMPRLRPQTRRSRPLASIALVAAFLLVAAACGDSSDSATPTEPAPTDDGNQAEPIGPLAPGADGPLPAVDVVDVASGATVSLTSYNTGQRPMLVWFWAPH